MSLELRIKNISTKSLKITTQGPAVTVRFFDKIKNDWSAPSYTASITRPPQNYKEIDMHEMLINTEI